MSLRNELIRETCQAWIEEYPGEAKAFAKEVKREMQQQAPGGKWKTTQAGYRKFRLPSALFWTMQAVFNRFIPEEDRFAVHDEDVKVLARAFPDLIKHNMGDERKKPKRRHGILTP